MAKLVINQRIIDENNPTYFIADIAANHDGSLERAKSLIYLAKASGADAVKFQHFRAEYIVSDQGFQSLGSKFAHQKEWDKSVFEVYKNASLPWEWTLPLKKYCDELEIDFFSSPYDFETIEHLAPFVPAFKIGSGDITWTEILEKFCEYDKPIILATGSSDIIDVQRAVKTIFAKKRQLALLQCNTNYTGSLENIKYVSLNVLKYYRNLYPEMVLGLSDHTPGHVTVLGAIALGARIIEKHFTDDNNRIGPDHKFSMNPQTWKAMINDSRLLESSFGNFNKIVEENERETVILQRRCLTAQRDLSPGEIIKRDMISVLRPAPKDSIKPYDMDKIVGMRLFKGVAKGQALSWGHFKSGVND